MGFFAMKQMVMESKWIVWADCLSLFRLCLVVVLMDVGGMMVDHHNHPAKLGGLVKLCSGPVLRRKALSFDIFSMPRSRVCGFLEECALRFAIKTYFLASVRLDVSQLAFAQD